MKDLKEITRSYLTKITQPFHKISEDAQFLLRVALREGLEVQRFDSPKWVDMDGYIFDPYETYRLKPDAEPKPEEQTGV